MCSLQKIDASFRDPSGFMFKKDGELYRQINAIYRENYDHLMNSGLYEALTKSKLLVSHREKDDAAPDPQRAYKVIKPEVLPFVSYPYEWCFSQLKDAASATLKIQALALKYGMSLKDGSAYNIQFCDGKPVLIDTLSFERYQEGQPWVAYRQFCQHFLAPLALMSYRDVRLGQLLRIYIDGIPLDLVSKMLPAGTWFKFSLLSHIHLHAKSQEKYADKVVNIKNDHRFSRHSFMALIDNLISTVDKIVWRDYKSEWGNYYDNTNYSSEAFDNKKRLVNELIDQVHPASLWDMGANDGTFSRIANSKKIPTVSFDIDPVAVERSYRHMVQHNENGFLPLIFDLTNPSPGIGWANKERMTLFKRGPVDMVMSLALVHHLAISNNLPFVKIAEYFKAIGKYLIIEFIPKNDSQVVKLLATRKDVFPDYCPEVFEKEFARYFDIIKSCKVADSDRTIYLMKRKENIK